MAKIYGQVNRIIIYLGKAAPNSDQAIKDIRATIESGSMNLLISEKSQETILKLLE